MSSWSPLLLAALVVALIYQIGDADAKRGCANFGHSCYGGMGKRANSDLNDEVAQEISQQEENPALVFTGPRSGYRPSAEQRINSPEFYLSPFLRQWLRSYRNLENLRGSKK